jgi:hypothetical protein
MIHLISFTPEGPRSFTISKIYFGESQSRAQLWILKVPAWKWKEVVMDFITGLLRSSPWDLLKIVKCYK